MNPALLDLLKRQQLDSFPDFVGSELSATIPVSERFINQVVARQLSRDGRVREVHVTIADGNQLRAEFRLSGPSFLPAIPVSFAIADQPLLPDRPTLGLRLMKTSGLLAMAGSLIPAVTAALPRGIAMDGDRITIDLRRLLTERGLEGWLNYLTDLRVHTRAGALVVDVRAQVRPSAATWNSEPL
jgi:hypothetical protein